MNLKKTACALLFLTLFSACGDVVFNNPLDPGASREELQLLRTVLCTAGGDGDITHDGEKIWKAEGRGALTAIEPFSGVTVRVLPVSPASGVAWHQGRLYVSSPQSNMLRSYDALSGALIKTHSTTSHQLRLISSDGERLVAYDERSAHVVVFYPDSGQTAVLFRPGGIVPSGLTCYRGGVLLSEQSSQSVYRFDMSGAVLGVYRSPVPGLQGICSDPAAAAVYLFTLHGTLALVTLP